MTNEAKSTTNETPTSGSVMPFEEIVRRIIDLAREHRDRPALIKARLELPYRDLNKLKILMYAGREGDSVIDQGRSLRPESHEITAGVISGKAPLAEYLTEGLRLAKEQSVDLDSDFA